MTLVNSELIHPILTSIDPDPYVPVARK